MVFLFLFQGALIAAISFFMTRVLLAEMPEKTLRRLRNLAAGAAVVITFLSMAIYNKSLPEDKPLLHASLPAAWVFTLFASVALGMTLALQRNSKKIEDGRPEIGKESTE